MTRPSLRAAIDAKCKGCIYDPISPGTWREQVEKCSSTNCPLHPVRPLPVASMKERAAERADTPPLNGLSSHELVFGFPEQKSDQ